MAQRFADQQVTFLGVAWKGDQAEYEAFLERHGLGFIDHLRDDTGEIFSSFGIRYQPGWAFVDDDGTTEIVAGGLDEEQLTQAVEELLAT